MDNLSLFFQVHISLNISQDVSLIYKLLTRCGTLNLITVIKTVIESITAIPKGHASAVVTGEGKSAALLHRRLSGGVLHTSQMIRS